MENKTTTELLDLYKKLIDKDGTILDQEKHDEWWEEIKLREPFYTILHEDMDEGLPQAWGELKELQEDVKKLKRHKHDEKTNDVLIRI